MFTLRSETKTSRLPLFIYIGVTLFCIAFGFIYEIFSHNVISYYMILGFLWPLCGGVIIYLLMTLLAKKYAFSILSSYLYNAGLATLTVGCYFHGIIEIYGTTRPFYVYFYNILGFILLGLGLLAYIVGIVLKIKQNKKEPENI